MNEKTQATLRKLHRLLSALIDSMERSARPEHPFGYSSYRQYLRKYNQIARAVQAAVRIEPGILETFIEDNVKGPANTFAVHHKELFDAVHVQASILRAHLENLLDLKTNEVKSLTDFLQARLRCGVFQRPERESEIQNAVESLLVGRGMSKGLDYDRETGRVKVSVKESTPDFIFPRLGLALEIKLSKDKTRLKEIVDEINSDIRTYGQKYAFLLFLVYDLGTIRDETEFKHGLELADRVSVIIVKH